MDIIIFSDDYDWSGHPSSTMHLARHLVHQHRVIWFNVIYRPPRLNAADIRRTVLKLGQMLRPRSATTASDDVIVRSPFTIPLFVEPFRGLNRLLFRKLLGEMSAALDLRDPIVIATNPFAVDFVRETKPWPAFYYCVDDYSEYPGVSRRAALQLEHELVRTVDGIAASARRLLESRSTRSSDIYLPHGVDVDHFAFARREFRKTAKPVIGFFGLLSDWVDVEYIAAIARARPAWAVELIGRVDTDVTALQGLANVNFRSPVPFGELPKAASGFDVGLIPFRINDLTRAVNPLKLLEYFAMGLPVVSTRLPEVEQFQPLAEIAETPLIAVQAIERLLAADSPAKRAEYLGLARQQSWEQRAQDLTNWIIASMAR